MRTFNEWLKLQEVFTGKCRKCGSEGELWKGGFCEKCKKPNKRPAPNSQSMDFTVMKRNPRSPGQLAKLGTTMGG